MGDMSEKSLNKAYRSDFCSRQLIGSDTFYKVPSNPKTTEFYNTFK